MSNTPDFLRIDQSALPYVQGVTLDNARYAEYLSKRGLPDEEIARTEVVVRAIRPPKRFDKTFDNPYTVDFGMHTQRKRWNPESKNTLYYTVPTNRELTLGLQGEKLRVETEWLLHRHEHPYHGVRNTLMAVGALTAAELAMLYADKEFIMPYNPKVGTILLLGGLIAYPLLAPAAKHRYMLKPLAAEREAIFRNGQAQTEALPDGVISIDFRSLEKAAQ